MNRLLLTLISLLAVLSASGRHYDFSAKRISTVDGLASNVVIQIWQDDTGYMWFDTRNGTSRYDGYRFRTFSRDSITKPQTDIKNLQTRDATWQQEGQGKLSRHGRDGTVREWQLIPKKIISYTRSDHFHVADVDERTEAVTTYGSGLFLYDKPTGELTQITQENSDGLLDDDYLTGLFVDRTGCIWVIEDYIGVKCLRMNHLQYNMLWLKPEAQIPDANHIRCIASTEKGHYLVSNQMGDVYDFDIHSGRFTLVSHDGYRVYTALRDAKGRLWTGTRGNGLRCDGKKIERLPSPYIFNLRQDRSGQLAVSMLEGGVALIDSDGRQTHLLNGYRSHDALRDRQGRLWIASEEGLFVMNGANQVTDSVKGCFVSLHESSDGTLWAGSTDKGLLAIQEKDGQRSLTYYNTKNGLANNCVYSIVEDRQGQLWLGTEEGLSRLNPVTSTIVNHQLTTSRLANVFCERAATCLPDGHLLFGTHNGIVKVWPEDTEEVVIPSTTITGLMVNGEYHSLEEQEVRLRHDENNVVLLFSNFQYARQVGVLYQYRLEGIDKQWNEPTTEHAASYRNLPPGHYTLRVRSNIKDGEWGQVTTLRLTILQPWWNTWWAWCLYVLVFTAMAVSVLLIVRRIVSLHRSLDVERRVSAFKQDFYNRIERELRNPINMVQGATENVQLSGTSKTTVQSLRRGSRRVLKLMDMIRQFHQLDDVEMRVRAEQDKMNEEAEQRFRDIQQSIHAEEAELKELAPPPLNGHTILIIESDEDNLTHLTDTLNPYFRVVSTLGTGDDALQLIATESPSLIIIDISDDERTGRELTKTIHKERDALPVVHLSAYDDDACQLRSLRAGAADYIVKPFSGRILLERITKIIGRTASCLQMRCDAPQQEGILTSVKDKRFLEQFRMVLAAHVSDENFSVEQFATLMNLSRTQFYKKVKELTGETPVQHLHRARLEYAARLLRQSSATVEEVMNRAGFNSPTHFYNAFKRQFGCSPRTYRNAAF